MGGFFLSSLSSLFFSVWGKEQEKVHDAIKENTYSRLFRFSGFSIRLDQLKIAEAGQRFRACPVELNTLMHNGVKDGLRTVTELLGRAGGRHRQQKVQFPDSPVTCAEKENLSAVWRADVLWFQNSPVLLLQLSQQLQFIGTQILGICRGQRRRRQRRVVGGGVGAEHRAPCRQGVLVHARRGGRAL